MNEYGRFAYVEVSYNLRMREGAQCGGSQPLVTDDGGGGGEGADL